MDERRLARSRHTRDNGQDAEGHVDVDIPEIVQARAADLERAAVGACSV
jgi:hypothetical protein